jgi:hypothetical protein
VRDSDLRRARNGRTPGPAPDRHPPATDAKPRAATWCDFTDLAADSCHHCKETTMELEAQLTATYRERAHLAAFLTVLYPSVIVIDGDPSAPGWALVYVDSPAGQLSWHLSGDDLDLFPHVQRVASNEVTWDGHTTEEKYERIRSLTAALASFGASNR